MVISSQRFSIIACALLESKSKRPRSLLIKIFAITKAVKIQRWFKFQFATFLHHKLPSSTLRLTDGIGEAINTLYHELESVGNETNAQQNEAKNILLITQELSAKANSMDKVSNELLDFSQQLKSTADTLKESMQEFKL